MFLTERFDQALVFARQRHNDEVRKGSSVPFISHPLSTAALVLEAGGDEDQAIAGLLHDMLEHGKATYQELVELFGERVARIVRECSDSETTPRPPWRERKERYLASLPHHPDSLLVSCADKVHNARSILSDYRRLGEKLWERFNPDSDILWYYRTLADAFLAIGVPLADEFERTVTELERLVRTNDS